ncbi:hypothetical protein AGLY_012275 [Aphis glycines]|uniref:Transcription factor CBF/NF-Y/archaeal histone domain-containing protein n=1 Tax=Aphis glycines TaxID=307491 RepID=A0A6G0T9M3_APHGL|nr:hypothetical protein AGLY_012275 [Aphis glycines]
MSEFLVDPSTIKQKKNDTTKDDLNTMDIIPVENNSENCNVFCLNQFWPKIIEEIRNIEIINPKKQTLFPLKRIKKVMQLDDTVKKANLETTIMLSKAIEMFIREITLRGWRHTEDKHRRTLMKNDISEAVAGYDQFDFLIDIVPKPEAKKGIKKTQMKTSTNPKQVLYYFQNPGKIQTNYASVSSASQNIQAIQPNNSQIVSLVNETQNQIFNIASNIVSSSPTTSERDNQPTILQLQDNTQTLKTNSKLVPTSVTHSGEKAIPESTNFNNLRML